MLRGVNQILNKGILLIAVILLLPIDSYNWAQTTTASKEATVINVNELENDGIREELQRYFGYDDLLFGYLTLPYDINQNINQVGRHVDNGFIYLALLPLMLLMLLYKRKFWFYLTMIATLLYLFVCLSFSRLGMANGLFISVSNKEWSSFLSTGEKGIGGEFLAMTYEIAAIIASPIVSSLQLVSGGEKDYLSYPILFTLFIIMLWLISSPWLMSKRYSQTIGTISVAFFALWWILSSGIVWYGFLMYPLLLSLIVRGIKRSKVYLPSQLVPFFKNLVMFVLIAWLSMAFVSRVSYVNQASINPENAGKEIASQMLMLYSVGLITADECREFADTNVGLAIKALNSDDRWVMRVGTHLEFEIKDNHLRVMEDNTLGLLFEYYKRFRNKEEFIEHLKSLGYGYIVLDLNTPLLDRTPEQTLKQKYQLILSHLYQNPKVRLVATNREVMITGPNRKKIKAYRVVGEEYLSYGTYAVYELL